MSGTEERDGGREYVTGDVLGPERYADLGIRSGEDAGDGALEGQESGAGADEGSDVTTAVEDHGNRLREPVHHHAEPGEGGWRDPEGAETDTPENTGSKVGPGREALQP